jgi:hypothetical protein
MSLQSILNQDAIDILPRIKKLIRKADNFERNQMYEAVLRATLNSYPTLLLMTKDQIDKFEQSLIDIFKYKEWIK